jgi:hypothetical protein
MGTGRGLADLIGPRKKEREKMGQTMQDLKKKGENVGKEQTEKVKETAEKGSDVAKEKTEQAKKKMGI